MERKVTRICSAVNLDGAKNKDVAGGHVSVKAGKYEETIDVINASVEDQIRFNLSVFGFGSSADCWEMNVYEFYRDFVRAYEANKRMEKKLKSNGGH